MSLFDLPSPLDNIFQDTEDLPVFFDRLMVGIVELLNCDRCHLYLRDPELFEGQVLHCHRVHPEIPNPIQTEIQAEDCYLLEKNPLFAAAIACQPTIFIDDIEQTIASSQDKQFWQENHSDCKSLIQAHLCLGSDLWGIVQIAQFNRSRPWTRFDRTLISQVRDKITPLTSIYARRKIRKTVQFLHDGNN